MCVMFQKCVMARALYDNIAESPDELAFRRGDQLTVLEQNTAGIEGWWLCALRGRQGICPGNRLRLVAGVYEEQCQGTLQRQGKRRSWHVQPNKVSETNHSVLEHVFNIGLWFEHLDRTWGRNNYEWAERKLSLR